MTPSAELAAANQRLLAIRRSMQTRRIPQGAPLHTQKSNSKVQDLAVARAQVRLQQRRIAPPAARQLPANSALRPMLDVLEGQGRGTIDDCACGTTTDDANLHGPSSSHSDYRPSADVTNVTLSISPSILHAMLKRDLAAIGRVWLLCRHLDANGVGWLHVDALRVALTQKHSTTRICGWRRLRQILQQGKGIFWSRDDRGRLWLYGMAKTAARLGVEALSYRPINLPISYLLQSSAATRAIFYASIHAARTNTPIARATLEQLTAVPARTQRAYDASLGIERRTNYAIGKEIKGCTRQLGKAKNSCSAATAALQEQLYSKSGGAFLFHDRQGHVGSADAHYIAHQLPNSYVCPWLGKNEAASAIGRTRWQQIRRQLRQHLVTLGTQGNGPAPETYQRRYHANGATLPKVMNECTYLQQSSRTKSNAPKQQLWIAFKSQ